MLDDDGYEQAELARFHETICPHCHKRFEKKFKATIYCGQCEINYGKNLRSTSYKVI